MPTNSDGLVHRGLLAPVPEPEPGPNPGPARLFPAQLDAFSLSSPALLAVVSPADAVWVTVNPSFAHAVGLTEREIEGSPIDPLIHHADAAPFRDCLAAIVAGRRVSDLQVRLLASDGSQLLVSWMSFARRGLVFLSGTADPAATVESPPSLLAEIQHRARNTLGLIRSIARRTARSSDSVEEFAAHLDGRLDAFARVQNAILRTPSHGIALDQLVADELTASAAREGAKVTISGPSLRLRPRLAEALGLALHELAINAIEHGSLARPAGRVAVRWAVVEEDGAPWLSLCWTESGGQGKGQVMAPKRSAFGLELLRRSLPYELGAKTEWHLRPDGVEFVLSVPMAEGVVKPAPTLPGG